MNYEDGTIYLTWYPHCLRALSVETSPPQWATYPVEPLRSEILEGTIEAMCRIVPALRAVAPDDPSQVMVRGGTIVAWGQTDIYDPASELHRRFEMGVTTSGRYHSVDPGKLTMAPFFASECATRIAG